jgi:serine/threonine protein kinase/Flp pilus assembly protein TadD
MGALYLAVHGQRGLEKLCAVKTALPHLAGRSYVQRFKDEAKVVVRLTHGNLVGVFDAGQVHGEIYLAMEFVEGKDLRAVWNRCAQKGIAFPLPVAAHIVKELVRGLAYAHSFEGLRLVHRDVSPPNVLLSYSGEVKLTDFGLATSTLKLEKTAPGVIFGKVSYMAPEQARAEALDGRCDIYSAGVILWELLTGRQLFSAGARAPEGMGQDQDDLLERVRHPQIVPPSKRAIRVPPELDAITMKALAVKPEERYQTGEELRTDLAAFLARTAPAMDGHQVAHFMRELFGDIIGREREERQALMAGAAALLDAPGDSQTNAITPVAAEMAARGDRADTAPLGRRGKPEVPADANRLSEEGSRMVGALLAGRYHIKRLRGEGSMGRVYEAEHIEIGKRLAVKVLHPAYSRTPDLVERFRREARAASRIEHPNVVNVTDFGTTPEGSLFFVMEYIEGIELGLLIHREGPLAINHALRITEQMCAALQAAHDAGVIHRDLKPENILLVGPSSVRTPSGHGVQSPAEGVAAAPDLVKVLDFGIAKSDEIDDSPRIGKRLTRPGVAMGTPEYMAPEQAAGHPADPRSDIYAVGSILYEMLTGIPPYDGENVMEILHKKANQPPQPILELRPDVPAPVVALVEKAMARDPGARPQSMAELAREIREVELALSVTPAPMLTTRRPTLGSRYEQSAAHGQALTVAGRLRALVRSRRWLLLGATGLAAMALALILLARGCTEAPVPAADAGAGSPTVPLPAVTGQAEEAADAQSPSDAEELDAGESQASAESAPSEENSKRSANSRPKAVHISPAAAQAQEKDRKLLQDARDFLRAQRFDEAQSAFEQLIHAGKNRGPALVGLAKIAFQKHDYQEAVNRAREGARVGGGAEARVVLGDAYFRLEKFSEARKAYEEALKLDADNRTARQNLDLIQRRGN